MDGWMQAPKTCVLAMKKQKHNCRGIWPAKGLMAGSAPHSYHRYKTWQQMQTEIKQGIAASGSTHAGGGRELAYQGEPEPANTVKTRVDG